VFSKNKRNEFGGLMDKREKTFTETIDIDYRGDEKYL